MIALRATHTAHRIVNEIRFPELHSEPPPAPTWPPVTMESAEEARRTYVLPHSPFWPETNRQRLIACVLLIPIVVLFAYGIAPFLLKFHR